MNKLREEIKKSIVRFEKNAENELEVDFVFSKDFSGFKGHFPNHPILPGVCKIQAVLVIYKEKNNSQAHLKKIINSKLFMPVSSDELVTFKYRQEKSNEGVLIKVKVNKNDQKVAEISLIVIDKKEN